MSIGDHVYYRPARGSIILEGDVVAADTPHGEFIVDFGPHPLPPFRDQRRCAADTLSAVSPVTVR